MGSGESRRAHLPLQVQRDGGRAARQLPHLHHSAAAAAVLVVVVLPPEAVHGISHVQVQVGCIVARAVHFTLIIAFLGLQLQVSGRASTHTGTFT